MNNATQVHQSFHFRAFTFCSLYVHYMFAICSLLFAIYSLLFARSSLSFATCSLRCSLLFAIVRYHSLHIRYSSLQRSLPFATCSLRCSLSFATVHYTFTTVHYTFEIVRYSVHYHSLHVRQDVHYWLRSFNTVHQCSLLFD